MLAEGLPAAPAVVAAAAVEAFLVFESALLICSAPLA